MRGSSGLKGAVITLACLGLLVPEAAIVAAEPREASSPTPAAVEIVDIALGSAQTLRGTVVDPDGAPVAGAPVVLLNGLRPVASTETDPNGRFVFAGVRGGVYGVGAAGSVRICRAWAPRTAPPAANGALLIVSDGSLVRGRGPLRDRQGRIYTWISEHPLVTYAGIAAAIAVPVVLLGNEPASP
ncbi:MAG: carboxypeptidase-like regulatory domain-containing protein [Planctomycetota bacterium]